MLTNIITTTLPLALKLFVGTTEDSLTFHYICKYITILIRYLINFP